MVFSPLSIYIALALTANGAVGDTQSEMLSVLKATSLDELNQKNKSIMNTNYSKSGNNIFNLANAVFSKVKSTPEFQSIAEKVYNSTSDVLQSAEQVNKWCSEKTNGKIKEIISNLSNDIDMILLNAVYFKGVWKKAFNKQKTFKSTFYDKSNNEISVDMMYEKIKTNYKENNSMQMVELPYSDDNFSSFVILPKEKVSIDDFILKMNNDEFMQQFNKMRNFDVEISLPRFTIEGQANLKTHLDALGMKSAFNGCANFSNLTKETALRVEEVVHKAYMKVDEEGTEAAAVTAVMMMRMCMPLTTSIVVNRPFLFLLKEKSIDQFLFIAKVEKITN